MKLVENQTDKSSSVNTVADQGKKRKGLGRCKRKGKDDKNANKSRECWNCGTLHNRSKKELWPVFNKKCLKCGNLSHFAAKCRSKKRDNNSTSVRAVNNDSELEVFYADVFPACHTQVRVWQLSAVSAQHRSPMQHYSSEPLQKSSSNNLLLGSSITKSGLHRGPNTRYIIIQLQSID